MTSFFIGLLSIIFSTIGQLLFKKSARQKDLYKNRYACLAYLSFVAVLIFSYLLMRRIDLKYFVVIMSMNYVTVSFASFILLKEKYTSQKIIGTFLVFVGVIVFSL